MTGVARAPVRQSVQQAGQGGGAGVAGVAPAGLRHVGGRRRGPDLDLQGHRAVVAAGVLQALLDAPRHVQVGAVLHTDQPLAGTQAQQGFLPEAQNDFIFSALAEERGFAGVLVALVLYLFVILRALESARLAKDRLGSYLVVGILACFTFQVIYNVTMSAGLAPVKGLTLPLMSYGGSSMIATLAGFGLILNVRMRRFTN